MNYLPYPSSVTLCIVQGHKALALLHRNCPWAQSPHRLSNRTKERKATSAYRGRVGQRAVEALTWHRHHHVIIGRDQGTDPWGIFGGLSVGPWSATGFGLLSAQRICGGRASTHDTRRLRWIPVQWRSWAPWGSWGCRSIGGRSPLVVSRSSIKECCNNMSISSQFTRHPELYRVWDNEMLNLCYNSGLL